MTSQKQFLLLSLTAIGACSSTPTEQDLALLEEARGNFIALEKTVPPPAQSIEAKRIALGRKLYLDPILSVNNQVSCNTCHDLNRFGVDAEPTSPGHEKKRGDRNSPTTLNAHLHFAQFWDGRTKDVEEQALGPILNPLEMGMASEADVIKKLSENKEYVDAFKEAYQDLTYKNVGAAIGAFERTLATPSRFDEYLKGDVFALSEKERAGLKDFQDIGCTACHNGIGIGGNSFQVLGAVEPYPTKDLGRYNITKDPDDKYAFKVPSLRNIVHTAPYFHDGSVADLKDAVKLMGKHQLGSNLTDDQVDRIVAFLGSLSAKETKF